MRSERHSKKNVHQAALQIHCHYIGIHRRAEEIVRHSQVRLGHRGSHVSLNTITMLHIGLLGHGGNHVAATGACRLHRLSEAGLPHLQGEFLRAAAYTNALCMPPASHLYHALTYATVLTRLSADSGNYRCGARRSSKVVCAARNALWLQALRPGWRPQRQMHHGGSPHTCAFTHLSSIACKASSVAPSMSVLSMNYTRMDHKGK